MNLYFRHLLVFSGPLECGMCLKRFQRWGIALTCCYINFVYFGIARSSSLLYLATLTQYNVDRTLASFPFILCYTVRNLLGPLIGFF
ncbi:hypothetical protein TNIN_162161 [Trichonephila inaurata madagascariensis]|uniref:Uncharacterized protein n=1 Tax=Trichonephila inaurata madagascariensis TaxID=2747483 RepID=A0A8X6YWF9_9ARAC|nr:hypothetical protein TNIN_162161 [Trichonephila inaurata madagascariensis]